MRTTLDIDDDVLRAAKERAAAQKRSAGELNGFPILRGTEGIVTSELVEKLLDEE